MLETSRTEELPLLGASIKMEIMTASKRSLQAQENANAQENTE